MTRDCRDTLFLLAAISAVVLPHAGHLPLWASVITGVILGWRALLAWRGDSLPGRWVLVSVLLLSAGLTWWSHRSLLGREAGVTLLVMLMSMKMLELRARRDAFVVFFLGFFLVLTHFLYSQSLLTAAWMLLSVWALLSAVVLAQMPVGQPSLGLAAAQAARTTLYGLPVMVLLFVLFPRVGPLWGLPADSIGRSGLSNQLSFGAMSELANDDSVAMRLRFEGAPPPPQSRYFRGPVLAQFDGRNWLPAEAAGTPGSSGLSGSSGLTGTAGFTALRQPDALRLTGTPLRYELTLEPLRISVVPMLEMSPEPAGSTMAHDGLTLRRGPELQWTASRPITERLRLNTQAYLSHQTGPLDLTLDTSLAMQSYLELPPGFNPRTMGWADALRRQARFAALDDAGLAPALAAAVLAHISAADFTYTLAPGRYGEVTPHLIDEFWFDRRLGFCEHFAASFVVVMRAMGVPARIVTGFQGMDAEMQDGYWLVRNSNAHAWAEYWVAGQGWLRADPTAAVAPERVLQGQALRPEPGALAGALQRLGPTLWPNLRLGWEALNNRWQQQVLNYSRQHQFALLKSLGFAQSDWLALGQLTAALIGVLAAAGGGWILWSARPHDAWSRQRASILRTLQKLDVAAQAHQGPGQWAALLSQRHGAAAEPAAALLLALERARYALADGPPAASSWLAQWRWWAAFRVASRMLRKLTR